MKAVVLGAGIIGMWTTHLLLKRGVSTKVISAREPLATTSAVAASVLTPFLPWDNDSEIFSQQVRWAEETVNYLRTLTNFRDLAQEIECYEFGRDDLLEDSFHVKKLESLDFSEFNRIDFSPPIVGNEFAIGYKCILCDPAVVLPWLFDTCIDEGAVFKQYTIQDMSEVEAMEADVIFNCLGFNKLFADSESYPVFGQSMFVPDPSTDGPFFGIGAQDHAVFRQRRGFYIGSHFIRDVSDVTPKREIYESSLQFVRESYPLLCSALGFRVPEINLTNIAKVQTGIRPFRDSGTKIAVDYMYDRLIVHNVGHGAHGWTIGYASAREAVDLAFDTLGQSERHVELTTDRTDSSLSSHESLGHVVTNDRWNSANLVEELTDLSSLRTCARMMASSAPWKELHFSEAQCFEELSRKEVDVYGITNKGREIIAFLASRRFGIGSEPMVDYLYVEAQFRGKGIGSFLMKFFEEVLFPDAANMYLFVSDINPRAATLYEKLGYVTVGTLSNYNLKGQTEYLYRKTRRPKQQTVSTS